MSGTSGRRGVGSYIRGLLAGLALEMAAGDDDIVLFGDGLEEEPRAAGRVMRVRLRRPRRAITLWDQFAWAPLLALRRVTVFHSPFYAVPLIRPRSCRVVQTIHDLTPLKLPGTVSRRNARLFRINFSLARRADRIIVPSEATKADVVSLLGIDGAEVTVIPLAADITPAELAAPDPSAAVVASRLGIRGRYILHTGGHDIVKNLPRLLGALAALTARGRDLTLVIAGEHGPATAELIRSAAATGLLDRVRLPGFVPRPTLVALYRGAAAVVYPSFTEGFGLPVLEAMACGAPVVASRAGAIPEVGGDACLYVDPSDERQIEGAIARILDDETLAADLSRRGRERAARFTWRETARRTIEVYRGALE
ncbi:MAG TPA: glycosyltransferase family 1 protein [Candidatus Polarisedimenticolia bacterium]|jgi:glycosyltransferase involved in cell wall biosynthesis